MKNKREKLNIVHVGVSGIPYVRNASVNRCIAIYSLLSEDYFSVYALNNRASSLSQTPTGIKKKGKLFNISYQYTPLKQYIPSGFFERRINNASGRFNELILLLKLGFKKEIDLMLFYPKGNFFELIYYRLFSKVFGFPLVSHYVEYRSAFAGRNNYWNKINDKLFDNYFMFFVNGVIPISEYLIEKIKIKRKKLPFLKIPPLTDFNYFKSIKKVESKYFLYVSHSGYTKAIELILESFDLIEDNKYHLYLILSGENEKIKRKIIAHKKYKLIKVFSNLDFKELIQYYINATALLIPLSNSIQDRARFPQKISEYLASKNPIITTNYGEIPYYFEDQVNALVAKKNTAQSIAEKMKFIITNQKKAKLIGLKGYETGLKHFFNLAYKDDIKRFMYNIIKVY